MSVHTPREVERWVPSSLGQVAGCRKAVSYFRELLCSSEIGSHTLLSGPSRSGKGAIIAAYIKSLVCGQRDSDTGEPCGACQSCLNFDPREDAFALYSECQTRVTRANKAPLHYIQINCGSHAKDVIGRLQALTECDGPKIVFLDEAHQLKRSDVDSGLLIPLQSTGAMCIAATANPDELDGAFLNRFSRKLATEKPLVGELVEFLIDRCQEFSLKVEDPQLATLHRVAQKSRRLVGHALSLLALAAGRRDRKLTNALIDEFVLYVDDLVVTDA